MNDLLQKLEAAMNERARVIEGSGYLGWLTFRLADGSMHYTAAAGSSPLDEPHWIIDGKEATGYASATIVYDEKRERRRVARDRKLLELAKVLREDYQDNAADHLIRLLAEDYEIEVES